MISRPVRSIARSLGRLSSRWLKRGYSFRKEAVRRLVRRSGFSEPMAQAMLEALFGQLTEARLGALLRLELRDPRTLDDFRRDPRTGHRLRARGPESIAHIFSSNIPNAPIVSFVLGMLFKSANIGKLSSRDGGFLELYLASLKTVDRELWRTNTLVDAKDRKSLSALLKKAGSVVAYGSDESLEEIRSQVPATTAFFAYGHRVSAGFYLKEAMALKNAQRLAAKAARDTWMADQRGCLSPAVLYVQQGGDTPVRDFAAMLAHELRKLQKREGVSPRRDFFDAAAAHRWQARHVLQKIKGNNPSLWQSDPRGLWTVCYEEVPRTVLAGSSQTVFVCAFKGAEQVYRALSSIQKYLQCVALECSARNRKKIAQRLSLLGVNRICRAGLMQRPPVTWHHDGKPNLASWINWTDLER